MNNQRLNEIIKQLNDNRSKLSALYSLYNSSLLVAENNRAELGVYYEQMIDLKNELNTISLALANAKKAERAETLQRNRSKIKRLDMEVSQANSNFNESTKNYRIALKDCGSLKTEYKHAVKELCAEFKSLIENEEIDVSVLKGYRQQVKIIKAILDKIELLISDYNVKKNKVEEDNSRFVALYESVNSMLERLEA